MIDAMNYAASAMNAFSTGISVSSHNVANVNTSGYTPYSVNYETGAQGNSVRVAEITRSEYGGLVSGTDYNSAYLSPSNSSAALPDTSPVPYESSLPQEALRPSGVDLSKEFPSVISSQRSYEAQAATIRVTDQMTGTLLDMTA